MKDKTTGTVESNTCVRDTGLESGYYVCPSESVIGQLWEGGWKTFPEAREFAQAECLCKSYSIWHVGFSGDAFRLSIR